MTMTICHRNLERGLAIVLLVAAASKLIHGSDISIHFGYGVVPETDARPLLIGVEAVLAVWMLVGGRAWMRFCCVISCFGLLAIAACFEVFHALPNCGCFGRIPVPPPVTAIFDITAVFTLWCTRPRSKTPASRWEPAIAITLLASVFSSFALLSASASAAGRTESANSTPSLAINGQFPLFDEINNSKDLRVGRWLIVFYHFDCDECCEALPTYLEFAVQRSAGQNQPNLAFVAVPPFAPPGNDIIPDSATVRRFQLRNDRNWSILTPLAISLQDGKVLTIAAGENAAFLRKTRNGKSLPSELQ